MSVFKLDMTQELLPTSVELGRPLAFSHQKTLNTPLRLSIWTHCTLDLYLLFQTIVSLLYINIGNIIPSCKTLAHSRLSPFAFTKDLISPATFLPFTTFPLHCIISSLFI